MRMTISPFRDTVKLIPFAFLFAAAAIGADVPQPARLSDQVEKLIKDALPVCSEEAVVSRGTTSHPVPLNMVVTVIRVQSKRQACEGQWLGIVSNEGGFYMGIPWFLDEEKGTLEEKLKDFGWKNLKQNFSATVTHEKTREGLYRVTLLETTERGKLPFQGEIDPAGTVFFIGDFFPVNVDLRTSRLKVFEPFVANSPTTGASKPEVTVIEFSDFECPSCQRAADYMKPILAKYTDRVRYVRYDLPLVTMHPWAFPAAVAGRAIYRQKPDLFWQYKEQVYANQEKLNSFTIDDFARGFAQDHDLDLKKFDADVNSAELRGSILSAAGAALSNDIRATPTYLVNGTNVDPGTDGKALETYVTGLLKK
jgi:protein-disulfide isomerase